ncbi:hypothetical protein GCM10007940_12980 [Portibacter lacus]|uniref:Uncharacterized protein n=1 Tax=Portibacter lacus TaxID=1099794 RepID=A0AA37SQD7_9BACT|nr:hypothetical protein GCM10007940_12980 [Portibacter lacus]
MTYLGFFPFGMVNSKLDLQVSDYFGVKINVKAEKGANQNYIIKIVLLIDNQVKGFI